MKRLLITFFFFALIIIPSASAQTITIPMPEISITPSPGPTPVNYVLPYPGILPGAPLYSVKMLRDKFTEMLTSDPYKKSNFYLLQADKRFAAFLILYNRGDKDKAFDTLLKSQKYLEKSYDKMTEAKGLQENLLDINGKIKASSQKQKEEILKLMKVAKGEDLEKLKESYQKAQEIENKANSFKP
jgi:hypothetical protein